MCSSRECLYLLNGRHFFPRLPHPSEISIKLHAGLLVLQIPRNPRKLESLVCLVGGGVWIFSGTVK